MRSASTRKPRCSNRFRIGPISPRCTPSGLITTSVFSIVVLASGATRRGAPDELFAVDDRPLVRPLAHLGDSVRGAHGEAYRCAVHCRDDGLGPNPLPLW